MINTVVKYHSRDSDKTQLLVGHTLSINTARIAPQIYTKLHKVKQLYFIYKYALKIAPAKACA